MLSVIVYTISGFWLANGMPHLVHGASRRIFRTPFGRYSTPRTNFLWGWFSWMVAAVLAGWRLAVSSVTKGQVIAIFIGAALNYLLFSVAVSWFMDDRKTNS